MNSIKKSFPADTTLEQLTFLNDPKINARLYAYLLSISYGVDGETRTFKADIPSQTRLAELMTVENEKPLSRQTVATHLKYLITRGYLIDRGDYYTLPQVEKMYFRVPLRTLQLILHSMHPGIIKVYIYLGQRNNYKPNQYVFTIKEICEHLGLQYNKHCSQITDQLALMQQAKLLSYEKFFQGQTPRFRLTSFSTEPEWITKVDETLGC